MNKPDNNQGKPEHAPGKPENTPGKPDKARPGRPDTPARPADKTVG